MKLISPIKVIIFSLFVFGCVNRTAVSKDEGVFVEGTRWASQNIRVCWEDLTNDISINNEIGSELVQKIVTKEYNRAGFNLSGWKRCTVNDLPNETIHIKIADGRPFGMFGCKTATSWCVSLNFDFSNWPNSDDNCKTANRDIVWGCYCKDMKYRKSCIESYALHEVGHALGLAHETSHQDNLNSKYCSDISDRDTDARDVGPYDPESIMNYCKNKEQITRNIASTLSDGDLKTLNKIYQGPKLLVLGQLAVFYHFDNKIMKIGYVVPNRKGDVLGIKQGDIISEVAGQSVNSEEVLFTNLRVFFAQNTSTVAPFVLNRGNPSTVLNINISCQDLNMCISPAIGP